MVIGFVDAGSPSDAGDFVGQGNSGAVMASTLLEAKGPGLEAIGVLGAGGGEKSGAAGVDQQGAEIRIATLGDGAQVAAGSAGMFSRNDAK